MEKKDGSVGLFVFGGITIFILAVANIIHLPFLISVLVERVQNGFEYGSGAALGALLIWIYELMALPVLICGIVFLLLHIKRKTSLMYFVPALVLVPLLAVQYIMTNLLLLV